jgi:glucose/mannose transport system permease protein
MTASTAPDFRTRLQDWLPKLVLAPSFGVTILFVYGFIGFTVVLSFTGSKMLPNFKWVGWENYEKLWALPAWNTAIINIAIFASLYIIICTAVGLMLAIFLDQKIRGEGVLRPIYLYPMALSFIVTGTAWKWFLDPGIGLEKVMHMWGWESFSFTWIKDSDMAIYTIVVAAVWQTSGFVQVGSEDLAGLGSLAKVKSLSLSTGLGTICFGGDGRLPLLQFAVQRAHTDAGQSGSTLLVSPAVLQ